MRGLFSAKILIGLLFCTSAFAEDVSQVEVTKVSEETVTKEVTTVTTQTLSLRSGMQTDRPYQSVSPFLMEEGRTQIEAGYLYEDRNNGGHENANLAPQFMIRHGFKDWELRVGWDGYTFREGDDIANSSVIGLKIPLAKQTKNMPEMAWVSKWSLPTGNQPHNDVDPQWALAWNYQVDEKIDVFGNAGAGAPTDTVTGDRFFQGLTSVGVSYKVNEQWTVFGEGYTNFPAADDEDAEYILQTGAKFLINDYLQLDAKIGFGINEQSPDVICGLGISGRI